MRQLNQTELDGLRKLGLLGMYIVNKTEFDALGKSVYNAVAAQSGMIPSIDDIVQPFAVEILAHPKFYAAVNGSAHLFPKHHPGRAEELSRYILHKSWSIIST